MNDRFTNMCDLNGSLAEALNLIDPNIENHYQQTAYMAYMIARAAGVDDRALALTRMAALLHDIGFITMDKQQSVAALERDAGRISELGATLIEGFPNSAAVAHIVRYCQSSWSLFALLNEHYEEIDRLREEAARSEGERYYQSLGKTPV